VLRIQTIKDETGKFGRWLRILFLDGVDMNHAMVEAGHAEPY